MKTRKRISAMLLAFVMVFSTVGYTPVAAEEHVHDDTCGYRAEAPCDHTTHDDACGYKEATEGTACNHEHDENCYGQVENCQHIHGDECFAAVAEATPSNTTEPTNCTHECTEESGCITKKLNCPHTHDGECGYVPAADEQPCKHEQGEHDETCGYAAGQRCSFQNSGISEETIKPAFLTKLANPSQANAAQKLTFRIEERSDTGEALREYDDFLWYIKGESKSLVLTPELSQGTTDGWSAEWSVSGLEDSGLAFRSGLFGSIGASLYATNGGASLQPGKYDITINLTLANEETSLTASRDFTVWVAVGEANMNNLGAPNPGTGLVGKLFETGSAMWEVLYLTYQTPGLAFSDPPDLGNYSFDKTHVRFHIIDGSLPDGIALDENGYYGGIGTKPGTFPFTVLAANLERPDLTFTFPCTITVQENPDAQPVHVLQAVFPQGLDVNTGDAYFEAEPMSQIYVGSSPVTVQAAGYPETITATVGSPDGGGEDNEVTFYRAGILKTEDGVVADTYAYSVVDSITIPAYPADGPDDEIRDWMLKWAEKPIHVAYVPQEPTQQVCNCTTLCKEETINQDCPVCKDATTGTVANVCVVKVLRVSYTLFPGAVSAGGGAGYSVGKIPTVTVGASGETTFTLDNATYPETITLEYDVIDGPKKGTYQRVGFLLVDEQGAAQTAASVEVPAFPSAGDGAEKSAWNDKWGGGLQVAYVRQEQTSPLVAGETYWFDLSGAGIPGIVNIGNNHGAVSVPDTTLHWVPFTYTGTITAYKVPNKDTASDTASGSAYAHSLFIADYSVVNNVTWDELNEQGLIFGKTYSAANVGYTLRAPSVGSNSENGNGLGDGGVPANNEWDQIPIECIKNCEGIYSWGQDISIYAQAASDRSARGYISARYYSYYSSLYLGVRLGFRPVLEILAPDTMTSDSLQVVTADLNGGNIGGGDDPVKLVVKAGEPFDAPSNLGITRNNDDFEGWLGDNGVTYQPDDSVPDEVNKLTAQWYFNPDSAVTPSDPNDDDDDDSSSTGNPISQPGSGTTIPIISGNGTTGSVTIKGGTNASATGIPARELEEHVGSLENSGVIGNLLNIYNKGQTKPGESGTYLMPGTESVDDIFGAEIKFQAGDGTNIQLEAILPPISVEDVVNAAEKITENSSQEDILAVLRQVRRLFDVQNSGELEQLYYVTKALCERVGVSIGNLSSLDPMWTLPQIFRAVDEAIDKIANRGNTGNGIIVTPGNSTGNTYTVEEAYAVLHIKEGGGIDAYVGAPSAGTLGRDANGNTTDTVPLMIVSTEGTAIQSRGSMTITSAPNGTTYNALLEGVTENSPFILCRIQYLALSNPFTDVATTDWFYQAVMELYSRGIMQGTSATTFTPGGPVTRAQAAQVLYNMDGRPQAAPGGVTSDIPTDAWYADAAAWAMGRGIVQVTGDRFGGDDPVSREELVEMLYRYAKYKGWDISVGENTNILSYKDFDQIGEEAITAFQWACGMAIVQGDGNGYLHPQDGLTRAELAQMLQRTLEKYKQPAAPVSPNTGTSKPQRHKVQKGDTLSKLAGKYKTTVEAIVRANPIITDPGFLRVGWELEIPQN